MAYINIFASIYSYIFLYISYFQVKIIKVLHEKIFSILCKISKFLSIPISFILYILFNILQPHYRTEEEIRRKEEETTKGPNLEILEHQRKRALELKCVEMEEVLEDEGLVGDFVYYFININYLRKEYSKMSKP